jgi:hypothetical protein
MKNKAFLPPGELVGLIGSMIMTLNTNEGTELILNAKKKDKVLEKRLSRCRKNQIKAEKLRWDKMENDGNLLAIGELAHMVGITVRTLQYYDEQDLLKPIVTEGGRRKYTREDVVRLEQILFL